MSWDDVLARLANTDTLVLGDLDYRECQTYQVWTTIVYALTFRGRKCLASVSLESLNFLEPYIDSL